MTLLDVVEQMGDEYEDYLCITEHDFEVDSSWRYEENLEYGMESYQ